MSPNMHTREDWDRLTDDIAGRVGRKLQGRLRDFEVHHVEGALELLGNCASFHVKQLAQEEVIGLATLPIRRNGITVIAA